MRIYGNGAMKLRKSREAMARIFAELVDYTKRHFGDEEDLMRKHAYDRLNDHEAQHKHFITLIKQFTALDEGNNNPGKTGISMKGYIQVQPVRS
jgi:hemerythrin-like metal-binding protein